MAMTTEDSDLQFVQDLMEEQRQVCAQDMHKLMWNSGEAAGLKQFP